MPPVAPVARTWSPPERAAAPGSANAVALAPTTSWSKSAPVAVLASRMSACAGLDVTLPKPDTANPRNVVLAAVTSSPTASPAPSTSSTSGRATVASARPAAPTVPPAPSWPALVSPTLAVCVVPSSAVFGSLNTGSGACTTTRATPAVSRFARPARRPAWASPSATIQIDASTPAVCPTCASPVLASPTALVRNWRSEPWPVSFTLTMVS